jgi:hypothetical protein
MTYLFPVWKYPEHPHGWKYGLEVAIKHVTSSQKEWKKCLADSVEHLAKKGPPPTDADGEPAKRKVWCLAGGGEHLTTTPVGAIMQDKDGRWFSDQCSDHLLVQVQVDG